MSTCSRAKGIGARHCVIASAWFSADQPHHGSKLCRDSDNHCSSAGYQPSCHLGEVGSAFPVDLPRLGGIEPILPARNLRADVFPFSALGMADETEPGIADRYSSMGPTPDFARLCAVEPAAKAFAKAALLRWCGRGWHRFVGGCVGNAIQACLLAAAPDHIPHDVLRDTRFLNSSVAQPKRLKLGGIRYKVMQRRRPWPEL